MIHALQKIRHLVLPSRPDPARSRRIAEGRLLIGCLVAFIIFFTIGVRIVNLADAHASARLALKKGCCHHRAGPYSRSQGQDAGW